MAEAVYEVMVKDETKKGLDEVNRNFRRTATEAGGLQRGIKGLSGSFGNLQTLAGLAAVTVGVKLVGSMIEATAGIARMSDTLGISTTTLQELSFAAGQTGTDLETISDASRTFSERILEVKQGSADAKEQFDFLGLSAERLGNLDTKDQLLALADALSDVENESEQVAIAQALLGDSGSELLNLFEDGSAGLARYATEARGAGRVLDEETVRSAERTEEAISLLTSSFTGVVNEGIATFLPAIEDVSTGLTNLFTSERDEAVRSFTDRFTELDVQFAAVAGQAPDTETRVAAIFAAFSEAENASLLVQSVVSELAAMDMTISDLDASQRALFEQALPDALGVTADRLIDLNETTWFESVADFVANDGPLSKLVAGLLGANETLADLRRATLEYEALLPALSETLDRYGEQQITTQGLAIELQERVNESEEDYLTRRRIREREIANSLFRTGLFETEEAENIAQAWIVTADEVNRAEGLRLEAILRSADAVEDYAIEVGAMEATSTEAIPVFDGLTTEFEDTGQAAVNAANDVDQLSSAIIGFQTVSDQLDAAQARGEMLSTAAAQHALNAAARGDDPFIAAQEALDALAPVAARINSLTEVTDLGGQLYNAFVGSQELPARTSASGSGRGGVDSPARPGESPEQRRQRLREEQEIRLLNQGITGGSLDLLLRLFDQDLALDDAGLRGARLAGGGQTQFEASLAGLLERRAQAASDKRERDRDTAAAERQAERDADKAEREAQRDADRADRDLQRQIDRQFANLADLAGLGLDTTEINRLQQLFDAEVGLTERQRDTLRIGGGGRTPYEQARFEAEERIREMAEALKKAMKEVDEENNRVCPPNAMTAHETVRSLEAVGRRGHIRSSRQGAEGLC